MVSPSIFQGLWQAVSVNVGQTIGAATHIYDVKSGETDKVRIADYQAQTLNLEAKKIDQKTIITISVVLGLLILVVFFIKIKKPNANV